MFISAGLADTGLGVGTYGAGGGEGEANARRTQGKRIGKGNGKERQCLYKCVSWGDGTILRPRSGQSKAKDKATARQTQNTRQKSGKKNRTHT